MNFKNGFYDPIEKKMIDHSPKYLSVNQIPFAFYPDEFDKVKENCANIRAYLDFLIPDPMEEKMMWEYLGYSMTSDTQFQKFMMLLGDGGTGKSVVIDMFQNIVGKKNSCHISLQDLNRRFYRTNLFGKLMNSCGEVIKTQKTTKALGHSWSSWKAIKKATALANGKKSRNCSVCNKKETKDIDKLKPTIKLSAKEKTIKVKKSKTNENL